MEVCSEGEGVDLVGGNVVSRTKLLHILLHVVCSRGIIGEPIWISRK